MDEMGLLCFTKGFASAVMSRYLFISFNLTISLSGPKSNYTSSRTISQTSYLGYISSSNLQDVSIHYLNISLRSPRQSLRISK